MQHNTPLPGTEQYIDRYRKLAVYTDGTLELTDELLGVTQRFTPHVACNLWDYLFQRIGYMLHRRKEKRATP